MGQTTTLTSEQIDRLQSQVLIYLRQHPAVCNKDIRNKFHLGYDQAIRFFNTMLARRVLKRVGTGSATKYTRH